MSDARVFIVEDNPDNLELFVLLLGTKYGVSGFGSATEALEAAKAVRPDLLVLDVGMKPIDGLQCLNAIRALPGCSNIPAIAVTAFARDVEQNAFLAAGFQAVVTKPVLDFEEFTAVVETAINGSIMRAAS
jgi:CheY-like chemotaxis protein